MPQSAELSAAVQNSSMIATPDAELRPHAGATPICAGPLRRLDGAIIPGPTLQDVSRALTAFWGSCIRVGIAAHLPKNPTRCEQLAATSPGPPLEILICPERTGFPNHITFYGCDEIRVAIMDIMAHCRIGGVVQGSMNLKGRRMGKIVLKTSIEK